MMPERATEVPIMFGAAPDPMRPGEIVVPPGVNANPPICPIEGMLLFPVNVNQAGDVLFECGACGYEAVLRIQSGTFEPRPFRNVREWAPPTRGVVRQPVVDETVEEEEEEAEEQQEEEQQEEEQQEEEQQEEEEAEEPQAYLSVREAATSLGITVSEIGERIASGRLAYVLIEGRAYIPSEALR